MYIPDKLKSENRFQDVAIPSNRSMFSRLGSLPVDEKFYSGDDVIPLNQSKSDSIEDYEKYAAAMAVEEMNKSNSK